MNTPAACEMLAEIHRGPGASIAFMAGNSTGDGLKFAGASRADDLAANWGKLPQRGTLYFSINSTGRVYPNKRNPAGLGFASRAAEHIRFLNAAFIEFDRHGDDWSMVSFPTLAANVRRRVEFIGLPEPSFIVYSGRGVWAIWQFKNPIPATGQAKDHWTRTGRALLASFAELKPDAVCSVDVTRIMRVPGSINAKAGGAVVTFERTGPAVEFYEFARLLGVCNVPTPITQQETERREKNAAKVRAIRLRWQKLLRGFRKLADMRGAFTSGQRSWAVFTLAKLGRLAGAEADALKAECLRLGIQGCSPSLETENIWRKITSGMSATGPGQWMSCAGICERFRVTSAELERIPELVSGYQRTERKRGNGQPYYQQTRPESRKTRALRELRLLAVDLGRVPSFAETSGRFLSIGLNVPVSTVYRYLKNLFTTDTRGAQTPPPSPPASIASLKTQNQQILNSGVRKNLSLDCSNTKNENENQEPKAAGKTAQRGNKSAKSHRYTRF